MVIRYFSHYDEMSQYGCDLLVKTLKSKPNLLVCAATGKSPSGLYKDLHDAQIENPELCRSMRLISLDEWGGLGQDHPSTCRAYLHHHLIKPLSISADRMVLFRADAVHPTEECRRVQSALDAQLPIDICILGLGVNGHIGFNEPAEHLQDRCHRALLSTDSLQHMMVAEEISKPSFGYTLGMEDILSARHIILLVSGRGKQVAARQLLGGKIDNNFPATHLWKHPNVDCLVVDADLGKV